MLRYISFCVNGGGEGASLLSTVHILAKVAARNCSVCLFVCPSSQARVQHGVEQRPVELGDHHVAAGEPNPLVLILALVPLVPPIHDVPIRGGDHRKNEITGGKVALEVDAVEDGGRVEVAWHRVERVEGAVWRGAAPKEQAGP